MENESQLIGQWQVFKRLLAYLKTYKWLTSLALAFLLLTSVVQTVIPLVALFYRSLYQAP